MENAPFDRSRNRASNDAVPGDPGGTASYVVTAADREWFGRCRRAWDLHALGRRALEPLVPTHPPDCLSHALLSALAVHYFPGMWSWNRAIVAPLVREAYDRAGGPPDGTALLERFQRWSPTVDRFTPVRIDVDVEVPVPDPTCPGGELSTTDGRRVTYRDRIPMVLIDDDDERVWLGAHRVADDFAGADELALDERMLTACWAWEQVELHAPVVGVHVTELRLDGELRRTVVPHGTTEKRLAVRRLGLAVQHMLDPDVELEPFPSWSHCQWCAFREPCLAMNRGEDADIVLSTRYRRRSTPGRPCRDVSDNRGIG